MSGADTPIALAFRRNVIRPLSWMPTFRVNSGTFPKGCGPSRLAATVECSSTTNLLICFILAASGQSALLGAGRNPAAAF